MFKILGIPSFLHSLNNNVSSFSNDGQWKTSCRNSHDVWAPMATRWAGSRTSDLEFFYLGVGLCAPMLDHEPLTKQARSEADIQICWQRCIWFNSYFQGFLLRVFASCQPRTDNFVLQRWSWWLSPIVFTKSGSVENMSFNVETLQKWATSCIFSC